MSLNVLNILAFKSLCILITNSYVLFCNNTSYDFAGDDTTDDESGQVLRRYEEEKACGGSESSFEELPDELERTVVQKFGVAAWENRCRQQCIWFTSIYRNDLSSFYIFKEKDRKEVCILN